MIPIGLSRKIEIFEETLSRTDHLIMFSQNRQGSVLPRRVVLGHINGTVGWLLWYFSVALLENSERSLAQQNA